MSAPANSTDWDNLLPLAHTARVVAAEGKLLALDKPPGIMTHPNREVDRNYSLLRAAYDHERECYHWPALAPGGPSQLFLLNRIDSPTSGLVLAALDEETAIRGREAFANGEVDKTYYALVVGQPRPAKGVWVDRLMRQQASRGHHGVRMAVGGPNSQGVLSKTNYLSMETNPNAGALLSLLKLEPITGRTHQLRVQCGAHRHPIVGDATYGDFLFNREFGRRTGHKRLFLHAAQVRIPRLGFAVESPLPREFSIALGKERPGS